MIPQLFQENMEERFLQISGSEHRNAILYNTYLCVLGFCFLSPCLYYCRVSIRQRRQLRLLRDMEQAGMTAAIAQSSSPHVHHHHNHHNHPPESAAIRDERRARILQLMEPVRMTLKEEHFMEVGGAQPLPRRHAPLLSSSLVAPPDDCDLELGQMGTTTHDDEDNGVSLQLSPRKGLVSEKFSSDDTSVSSEDDTANPHPHDFDEDEESIFIRIPLPGLVLNNSALFLEASDANETTILSNSAIAKARTGALRTVPGFCTICLSGYTVGSDIVWSSNRQCEHVFHTDCMVQWLTKQQRPGTEGPICPCCRRDFIVDPYDLVLTLQADDNESCHPIDADTSATINNDDLGAGMDGNRIHVASDKSHTNPDDDRTTGGPRGLPLNRAADEDSEAVNTASSHGAQRDDNDNIEQNV